MLEEDIVSSLGPRPWTPWIAPSVKAKKKRWELETTDQRDKETGINGVNNNEPRVTKEDKSELRNNGPKNTIL
jgi:hypothetical protein